MACTIRRVQYFYVTVEDAPGEAYQLLSVLASSEVNLLAFNAVPMGPSRSQLTLFPEDPSHFARVAERANIPIVGPQHAFLIQGDDELGALTDLHRRLANARINVYASNGITDGRGGFGYLLYVRSEDSERADHILREA